MLTPKVWCVSRLLTGGNFNFRARSIDNITHQSFGAWNEGSESCTNFCSAEVSLVLINKLDNDPTHTVTSMECRECRQTDGSLAGEGGCCVGSFEREKLRWRCRDLWAAWPVVLVGCRAAGNRSEHRRVECCGRRRSSSSACRDQGGGAGPKAPVAGGGNAWVGPPKATGTLEASCGSGAKAARTCSNHRHTSGLKYRRGPIKCALTAWLMMVHNTR